LDKEKTFQSTPLREGRPIINPMTVRATSFNPRPCARGDAPATMWATMRIGFQSTPLREGRLLKQAEYSLIQVSIHAPARGATGLPQKTDQSKACFNPRPCARGDGSQGIPGNSYRVSIHAPARGATRHHASTAWTSTVSIHAPARGATTHRVVVQSRSWVSIHAPARGATPRALLRILRGRSFNPRPCARGDEGPHSNRNSVPVSIHAPARGAT